MTKRILIMGLPGAGKTTLAQQLVSTLAEIGHSVVWHNADQVRKDFNDWDFSNTGRLRQSLRMRELADKSSADYAVCDFVAPLQEMRNNFAADYTVWVDTISEGRFADTNSAFTVPNAVDVHVTTQNSGYWVSVIINHLDHGCTS